MDFDGISEKMARAIQQYHADKRRRHLDLCLARQRRYRERRRAARERARVPLKQ